MTKLSPIPITSARMHYHSPLRSVSYRMKILWQHANHLYLTLASHARPLFAQKLRNFSENSLLNFFWDFSKFGLSIKSWFQTPSPIKGRGGGGSFRSQKGILVFSRFGPRIKSWFQPPCPPGGGRGGGYGSQREFWVVADLDSGSKVVLEHSTPTYGSHREFWF